MTDTLYITLVLQLWKDTEDTGWWNNDPEISLEVRKKWSSLKRWGLGEINACVWFQESIA